MLLKNKSGNLFYVVLIKLVSFQSIVLECSEHDENKDCAFIFRSRESQNSWKGSKSV